eukprot:5084265-Pyramimonas_sp.AAC.1
MSSRFRPIASATKSAPDSLRRMACTTKLTTHSSHHTAPTCCSYSVSYTAYLAQSVSYTHLTLPTILLV